MLLQSYRKSAYEQSFRFFEDGTNGLVGDLWVTYTVSITKEDRNSYEKHRLLDIIYLYEEMEKTNTIHLRYKEDIFDSGVNVIKRDAYPEIPDQPKISKELYDFLKENLPERMSKLIPEDEIQI